MAAKVGGTAIKTLVAVCAAASSALGYRQLAAEGATRIIARCRVGHRLPGPSVTEARYAIHVSCRARDVSHVRGLLDVELDRESVMFHAGSCKANSTCSSSEAAMKR